MMQRAFGVMVLITAAVVTATVSASGDPGLELEEVAPGVFVHFGAHAALASPARADSANIGFIVGQRCVAVIDTGGAYRTGQQLAAALRATTPLPVCYVINTHVHFDHVLGNAAFVADGVQFAGHARLADAMAANRDFFAENFAQELGGADQQARIVEPDLLVENEHEIDLGQRKLTLRAVPAAHSGADLTVHDQTTGTLWTGDLLFRERMPVLDGSLRGWLDWMSTATDARYRVVVPGHGPVDRVWPEGLSDQQRYFLTLLKHTRAAIARGAFIDEVRDTVAADEPQRWVLTERAHGLNISRAFRELEWE